MTTQMTTLEERRGGLGTLIGASAVTLVMLVGAALWLVWPDGGAATAPPTSAERHEVAALSSATVTPARSTTADGEDVFVYLVGSPEQALEVQARVDATRAFMEGPRQAGSGISLPEAVVLLAGTPEDEVRAAQIISDTHHIRLTTGRPDLRVVDLRPATANVPPRTEGSGRPLTEQPAGTGLRTDASDTLDDTLATLTPTGATGDPAAAVGQDVYLVGSEVAATAARPLAVGADQVLVVETEEDAAQVRIGLGRPGTRFIDLRSSRAMAWTPGSVTHGCGLDTQTRAC